MSDTNRQQIRTDQRFGKWTAITFVGNGYWMCRCDCGNKVKVATCHLRTGRSTQCRKCSGKSRRTHCGQPKYLSAAWNNIKQRCKNPKSPTYKNYGGRGISICFRWDRSFEDFRDDVGLRPSPKHSIDRIDNNGNYEPGNVRWALPVIQHRNTRVNRFLSHKGKTMTVTEWSKYLNMDPRTLFNRLRKGWSVSRSLSEPVNSAYRRSKRK